MDGQPTWTDCDEAGNYVVPNVLSPRDLVSRPDIMDETVPHTTALVRYISLLFSQLFFLKSRVIIAINFLGASNFEILTTSYP